MTREKAVKIIAQILKDNRGSHEFEKLARLIMKSIGWTHLNKIRAGLTEILSGQKEFHETTKTKQETLKDE